MDNNIVNYILEQMYEVRDTYGEEIKYNLKPRNNDYGKIVKKVLKIGYKKIITLKIDTEEIAGWANLFIYESLITYDGDIDDLLELDKHIITYCYNRFNELSKNNGINYKYIWNKSTKKYELIKLCELDEEINIPDEVMEEDTDAKDFIDSYINTDYLTEAQVKYCMTVLEYGPSNGKGIYDHDGNLLYSKQLANYYNKEIRNKLEKHFKSFTKRTIL